MFVSVCVYIYSVVIQNSLWMIIYMLHSRGFSTQVKELTAATHVMQSSSNELSTLVVTRWVAFISVGVNASWRIPLSVLVRNLHKGLAREISHTRIHACTSPQMHRKLH